MEDDLIKNRKTTSKKMEDDLKKMEDDLKKNNGRQPKIICFKWKTTKTKKWKTT